MRPGFRRHGPAIDRRVKCICGEVVQQHPLAEAKHARECWQMQQLDTMAERAIERKYPDAPPYAPAEERSVLDAGPHHVWTRNDPGCRSEG